MDTMDDSDAGNAGNSYETGKGRREEDELKIFWRTEGRATSIIAAWDKFRLG
jgi:hypothetical protein